MFRKIFITHLSVTLILTFLMTWNSYASKSELVELKTRANVTQKFIFITTDIEPKDNLEQFFRAKS